MSATNASLLSVRGLGKRFPGVVALDGVDLTVRGGEIHALLGENGAGKSTLIKVLTGVYARDSGEIRLSGALINPISPSAAESEGITTVYQEVNLIPSLSIAENLTLGRQPGRFGFISWRTARIRAREMLARLGLELDVDGELGAHSVAVQQLVAIARALDRKAKLLILDEPTASLDAKEVEQLFGIMRQLRSAGLGLILVTHFLDQVYAVCDRMTVLRNGRLVGEYRVAETSSLSLVSKMLGREMSDNAVHVRVPEGTCASPVVLSSRGLSRKGALHSLSLDLRRGEILGLAGLLGSGRTESARLLFGIDDRDKGEIDLDGRPVRMASPREAIRHGLAFCSEDRKSEGILPSLSVRENLVLALQAKRGGFRALTMAEQEAICHHYVTTLKIKLANLDVPVRTLSGGNQQKVLLARWLATQPRVIILDEPTRGIDIGARGEIEELIAQLRQEGLAILLISSEPEEILRLCTRIIVLRERRQVGELSGETISLQQLLQQMAGTQHRDHA